MPRARKDLEKYCVYIMPMANKDGVARGKTRFNSRGKDLNRDWDRPADPILSPENHGARSVARRHDQESPGSSPGLNCTTMERGNCTSAGRRWPACGATSTA